MPFPHTLQKFFFEKKSKNDTTRQVRERPKPWGGGATRGFAFNFAGRNDAVVQDLQHMSLSQLECVLYMYL